VIALKTEAAGAQGRAAGVGLAQALRLGLERAGKDPSSLAGFLAATCTFLGSRTDVPYPLGRIVKDFHWLSPNVAQFTSSAKIAG
jgi:hypothetical protein